MLWKIPGWAERFVAVTAERLFREYVQKFVEDRQLTPSTLDYLARTDTSLSVILGMMNERIEPIPQARENAFGAHLLGLSDQAILGLLREAVPTHRKVLDQYPGYAAKLAREIKQLVLGNG